MVMGTDGIPIEKLVIRPDPNMDAVAAEYTTLLRASVSAAADTGLGDLQELSIVTEKMVAMLVAITSEYFLFAALVSRRDHRPRALRPAARRPRAREGVRLGPFRLRSVPLTTSSRRDE